MEEPLVLELPSFHVLKLRYDGPPPPDERFLDHWRRFRDLTDALRLASNVPQVQAIGYAPPVRTRRDQLVYDACLPVPEGLLLEPGEGLELGDVPGGRYVLASGPVTALPELLDAARRYAMGHGLAIERGHIEIYRPLPPGADLTPVDVGYRVHD